MRWTVLALVACGPPGPYRPCDEASQCPEPDGADAACVDGGGDEKFCSLACADDGDCADALHDDASVCASFESTEGTFCFPSCGPEAPEPDVCPHGFECRSTGGGGDNRKVCYPT